MRERERERESIREVTRSRWKAQTCRYVRPYDLRGVVFDIYIKMYQSKDSRRPFRSSFGVNSVRQLFENRLV